MEDSALEASEEPDGAPKEACKPRRRGLIEGAVGSLLDDPAERGCEVSRRVFVGRAIARDEMGGPASRLRAEFGAKTLAEPAREEFLGRERPPEERNRGGSEPLER